MPVSSSHRTAIYALTPLGLQLGRTLCAALFADLHLPRHMRDEEPNAIAFDRLTEQIARTFSQYDQHIFITACGIAIRCIAPHLRSKGVDPAVICLDQEGKHVVSLVSGHIGGANDLAREVAVITGGDPIITTATDNANLPALDEMARKLGLHIANLHAIKTVSAALLADRQPQLFDPEAFLGLAEDGRFRHVRTPIEWDLSRPGAWVHWTRAPKGALGLHPPCLIAGMGCRRGTDAKELLELLHSGFQDHGLALESLAAITSIDAKHDEAGLLEVAHHQGLELTFYTKHDIDGVAVPSPSTTVRKHMGVDSVCEATAILKSGNGPLVLEKTKSTSATLAVAVSAWPVSDQDTKTT